jgi:hypothetical protein
MRSFGLVLQVMTSQSLHLPPFIGCKITQEHRLDDLLANICPLLFPDQDLAPDFRLRIYLISIWRLMGRVYYKQFGEDRNTTRCSIHRLVMTLRVVEKLSKLLEDNCVKGKLEIINGPGARKSQEELEATAQIMRWNEK